MEKLKDYSNFYKNPKISLEKPFVDARGVIQPLVDEVMKSAVLINSVKGSIRANHYHKTDWHFCYILKGKMEYYFRNTGDTKDPKMIEAISGEMVFTPPMVDHAMKFTEDTSFLTLSKNLRD